jgi:hypothetical protein
MSMNLGARGTRVSRRGLAGVVVALAALVLCAAGAAAPGVLDQSQGITPPDNSFAPRNVTYVAQTFTAGLSGRLVLVDLLLSRLDPLDRNLVVQIQTTAKGLPSGLVLDSAKVTPAQVPVSNFPDLSFVAVPLSGSQIVAGTQYAVVVSDPAAAPFGGSQYLWGGSNGNPYPGGEALLTFDGGGTWLQSGLDMGIKTYVELPLPLQVRGSGFVLQHDVPLGVFAVDMSFDGVTAKGGMAFALPVVYQGKQAYLTASSTSPRFAYVDCKAGKPVSATFSGDGSFVLRSLRGSVLLRGAGYIKATVDEGRTGTVHGYVAPTGPPFMPEIVFPDSTFVGHLDISNAYCPT